MIRAKRSVDPRNRLNDLTGKEWLQLSRSWWFQTGLGKNHPEASIEAMHPAPFSFHDIRKLVQFFTKPGMTVLDPFCGVASTLKAAALCERNAIGIELSPRWVRLGKRRLEEELPEHVRSKVRIRFIRGDCIRRLPKLARKSVDFIVTSPPYWNILNKDPDHKVISERLDRGLETRYSKSLSDLGNVDDYDTYLMKLRRAFRQCLGVLKRGRYMVVIVGDFRHKSVFYPFHIHAAVEGEKAGFRLRGVLLLIQGEKRLFPYGYPFDFVPNIHHQYALIFQRPVRSAPNPSRVFGMNGL
ncbi:MAG TPA: DNA methyltransferase [Thermoplasmata archaeon]